MKIRLSFFYLKNNSLHATNITNLILLVWLYAACIPNNLYSCFFYDDYRKNFQTRYNFRFTCLATKFSTFFCKITFIFIHRIATRKDCFKFLSFKSVKILSTFRRLNILLFQLLKTLFSWFCLNSVTDACSTFFLYMRALKQRSTCPSLNIYIEYRFMLYSLEKLQSFTNAIFFLICVKS